MNFKPTLWKSVVSIIAVVLADILIVYSSMTKSVCISGLSCPSPYFDIRTIIISIIVGLVVYIVWSLVQKKR